MSMKLLFGQVLFLIAITFGLESNSSAQYSYGGTILTVDSLVNGMHGNAFHVDDHLEAKSTGQEYNSASSAGDMHFMLSIVVDAYKMDGTVEKGIRGDIDHDLFVAPGNSSKNSQPQG